MKSDRKYLISTAKSSLIHYLGLTLFSLGTLVPGASSVLAEENLETIKTIAQVTQSDNSMLEKEKFRIGVMAIRGKVQAVSKWGLHMDYLSQIIPDRSFELVPLAVDEVESAIANQDVEFVITNPGMYVNLEAKYGINRIVSLKNKRLGKAATEFGAVIFTKADRSDINEITDFKGKTFAGVSENAFGGWQMAWDIFLNNDVVPKNHLKKLDFLGTHDDVVKAVLNGEVDGGTVRTDTLERLAEAEVIRMEDFKIINPQTDDPNFEFVRSTPLYPEWAFSAIKGAPLELEEEIAKALLEMSVDSPAAKTAKIYGWTVPFNYRPVHELFIDLKVAPYDNLADFTTAQLLQRLGIVLGLAVAAIAGVTVFFQRRNLEKQKQNEQALTKANQSLEGSLEEQKELKEQQELQKQELETAIYALIEEIADAADGDLTVRASLDSLELSTVADLFNSVIENLQDIAIEARESSGQVGFALKQNELAIRELAEQAVTEATETRTTLDSVQQMTTSIQAVAQNANQAQELVGATYQTVLSSTADMDLTVDSILSLRNTVGETAKKIKRLGESSQKISQVVSFIEEIALKTNILAINATVEAGRAGEYGEGFSIVAEQVATLAEQAATATKEIAEIVAAIQTETQEVNNAMESGTSKVVETTRLVESTKDSLGQVLTKSKEVNQLINSISQSTVTQANTSQSVTNLMEKIAQLSENTSQSSEEVAQSIGEVAQIAQKLEATVTQFKVG